MDVSYLHPQVKHFYLPFTVRTRHKSFSFYSGRGSHVRTWSSYSTSLCCICVLRGGVFCAMFDARPSSSSSIPECAERLSVRQATRVKRKTLNTMCLCVCERNVRTFLCGFRRTLNTRVAPSHICRVLPLSLRRSRVYDVETHQRQTRSHARTQAHTSTQVLIGFCNFITQRVQLCELVHDVASLRCQLFLRLVLFATAALAVCLCYSQSRCCR